MKKGFALIELAIVVVIIGLIIGGILAARSMVATANINGFVRQIQGFDIAAQNFYTKYNQIPGDASNMSPAGDNDTNIVDDNVAKNGDGDFLYEMAYYWYHLYIAGQITKSYSYSAASGVKLDVNVPRAKIGVNAGILVGQPNDVGAPENLSPNGINIYYISGISGGTTNFDVTNAISAPDAAAADFKMDDGRANSGAIVAQGAGTDISSSPLTTAGSGCISSSNKANYLVGSTAATPCSLAIRLSFSQSKDLY